MFPFLMRIVASLAAVDKASPPERRPTSVLTTEASTDRVRTRDHDRLELSSHEKGAGRMSRVVSLWRRGTRTVVAVGAESEGQLADRGGLAVARLLGVEPVTSPSRHRGFIGEDTFMKDDPDALRVVLQQVSSASPVGEGLS